MKKYAFRIFYLGDEFQGFQRQPNGFAIENYLEYSFIAGDYIDSFKSSSYQNASRTDTGVHALGNIISLNVRKEPILDQINSFIPRNLELQVYDFAEVPTDFNPRNNVNKIYEYYLPPEFEIYSLDRISDFVGTHDFNNFIRSGGAGQNNPITNIQSFEIIDQDEWKILRIIGDSFGREQIRRMIGFLMEKKYSDYFPRDVLTKRLELSIKSAPASYLVLHDIIYDNPIDWRHQAQKSNFACKLHIKQQQLNSLTKLKSQLTSRLIQRTNLSK
jgi:tRNA pseudouridine(38-40) synthase